MQQQRQNTAGNVSKKTIRIPLVGNSLQRNTTEDKDQRFVNYIFETTKNEISGLKKFFLVKRPGTSLHLNVTSASEGRGTWYFNSAIWSVFGNTLYKNNTAKQILSTSTGLCGAIVFNDKTQEGKKALFVADGIDAWIVDNTDTVTKVDTKYLQWAGDTFINAGDRRVRTNLGHWFVAQNSGKTGSSEPTWVTTTVDVSTTVDNEVTWLYKGTFNGYIKYINGSKALGDIYIPTTENGYYYEVVVAGSTLTEPTEWPITIGETIVQNTTTFECKGQYGGFPTPHVPTPQYMDGYIFLPTENSQDIWNSDVNSPFSWGALAFASAENHSDSIIGLSRQNNFLVAFGETSTEFLYNSAKSNGFEQGTFDTPLDRYESMVIQTGCISRTAILASERTLLWVAESALGGKAIWRIDGASAKEVSTEYIEKFIDLETPSSGVTGFGFRVNGHMLFLINLPTANKTFVYDLEENIWGEWSYNGGMLPFVYFTDANGVIVFQHKDNGKLYKLSTEVYTDFDSPIECLIRMLKQDFDTDKYKFFHKCIVIGDKAEGNDILSWSDDDFNTTKGNVTLQSTDRPYTNRSGFARRRSWQLEYTHDSPRRLEGLEVVYTLGDH